MPGPDSGAVEPPITEYARLAGLEGVTLHPLRYGFGKCALDAGADLVSASELSGHQRRETTAIHTTASRRDLERAVERLEQDGDLRRVRPATAPENRAQFPHQEATFDVDRSERRTYAGAISRGEALHGE